MTNNTVPEAAYRSERKEQEVEKKTKLIKQQLVEPAAYENDNNQDGLKVHYVGTLENRIKVANIGKNDDDDNPLIQGLKFQLNTLESKVQLFRIQQHNQKMMMNGKKNQQTEEKESEEATMQKQEQMKKTVEIQNPQNQSQQQTQWTKKNIERKMNMTNNDIEILDNGNNKNDNSSGIRETIQNTAASSGNVTDSLHYQVEDIVKKHEDEIDSYNRKIVLLENQIFTLQDESKVSSSYIDKLEDKLSKPHNEIRNNQQYEEEVEMSILKKECQEFQKESILAKNESIEKLDQLQQMQQSLSKNRRDYTVIQNELKEKIRIIGKENIGYKTKNKELIDTIIALTKDNYELVQKEKSTVHTMKRDFEKAKSIVIANKEKDHNESEKEFQKKLNNELRILKNELRIQDDLRNKILLLENKDCNNEAKYSQLKNEIIILKNNNDALETKKQEMINSIKELNTNCIPYLRQKLEEETSCKNQLRDRNQILEKATKEEDTRNNQLISEIELLKMNSIGFEKKSKELNIQLREITTNMIPSLSNQNKNLVDEMNRRNHTEMELRDNVKLLEKENHEKRTEIASFEQEKGRLQNNLNELQTNMIPSLRNQNTKLENILRESKTRYQNELSVLKSENEDREIEKGQMNNTLKEENQMLELDKKELLNNLNELQSRMITLLSNHSNEIQQNINDYKILEENYAVLDKQKDELYNRNFILQRGKVELVDKINNLESKITNTEFNNNDIIQRTKGIHEKEMRHMSNENILISKKHEELIYKFGKMERQIEALRNKETNYSVSTTGYSKANEKLKNENMILKEDKEELTNTLNALQVTMIKLQQNYNSNNSKIEVEKQQLLLKKQIEELNDENIALKQGKKHLLNDMKSLTLFEKQAEFSWGKEGKEFHDNFTPNEEKQQDYSLPLTTKFSTFNSENYLASSNAFLVQQQQKPRHYPLNQTRQFDSKVSSPMLSKRSTINYENIDNIRNNNYDKEIELVDTLKELQTKTIPSLLMKKSNNIKKNLEDNDRIIKNQLGIYLRIWKQKNKILNDEIEDVRTKIKEKFRGESHNNNDHNLSLETQMNQLQNEYENQLNRYQEKIAQLSEQLPMMQDDSLQQQIYNANTNSYDGNITSDTNYDNIQRDYSYVQKGISKLQHEHLEKLIALTKYAVKIDAY